jgi:hypothetical protein
MVRPLRVFSHISSLTQIDRRFNFADQAFHQVRLPLPLRNSLISSGSLFGSSRQRHVSYVGNRVAL